MTESEKSTGKTQSPSNEADSEKSDQHWQSCVDKLNAETDAVLETIKGTSWQEADGAFTKNVRQGLDMLSTAYFAISKQNAPEVYVTQSRNNIAKAIVNANIIPNICGVFSYVYKQNLDQSESQAYDAIGIDAPAILCNFAMDYDEFAKEIADCPGFLEFTRQKLLDLSEKYLQSEGQVRIFEYCIIFLSRCGKT